MVGKLYTKTTIIEYCTKENKETNNRYNKFIENINEEKLKPHPDYKKNRRKSNRARGH